MDNSSNNDTSNFTNTAPINRSTLINDQHNIAECSKEIPEEVSDDEIDDSDNHESENQENRFSVRVNHEITAFLERCRQRASLKLRNLVPALKVTRSVPNLGNNSIQKPYCVNFLSDQRKDATDVEKVYYYEKDCSNAEDFEWHQKWKEKRRKYKLERKLRRKALIDSENDGATDEMEFPILPEISDDTSHKEEISPNQEPSGVKMDETPKFLITQDLIPIKIPYRKHNLADINLLTPSNDYNPQNKYNTQFVCHNNMRRSISTPTLHTNFWVTPNLRTNSINQKTLAIYLPNPQPNNININDYDEKQIEKLLLLKQIRMNYKK